ncbi:MAG TPA: aspartate aminotransferase family protein [Streptosporangiaceae bacterium]
MSGARHASGHLFSLDPARTYPVLARGDGVYVWDADGNRYLDAIAGIAVMNLGYGRREIIEAMRRQAELLPFAVGNIFSNEPAEELAAQLAQLAPAGLDWVHFSSGGSEANEIAIKLARQYHVERGQPGRHLIISRWTSYHGATLATLAASGNPGRRRKYQPLLLDFPHIAPSYCYRCPFGLTHPACGIECAIDLERAIEAAGPERVAAFIVEPVVASVGGAIAPVPGYFPMIREICDRHDILLIADEVVTGLGRTGANFGVDHWSVTPDIITLGKGASAGYAPLGAVIIHDRIRAEFAARGAAFEHIFTFGGNPVSAAVGLAVLAAWRDEQVLGNVRRVAGVFRDALEDLRKYPFVGDVRTFGLMAGIEFVADRDSGRPFPPGLAVAALVREAGMANGIVTYPGTGVAGEPGGDIISLYPPLTFTPRDVDEMRERLIATFDSLAADLAF